MAAQLPTALQSRSPFFTWTLIPARGSSRCNSPRCGSSGFPAIRAASGKPPCELPGRAGAREIGFVPSKTPSLAIVAPLRGSKAMRSQRSDLFGSHNRRVIGFVQSKIGFDWVRSILPGCLCRPELINQPAFRPNMPTRKGSSIGTLNPRTFW